MPDMKQLAEDVRKNSAQASFTNQHGERFTIYSDGHIVLMSGDEVNAMVNPKFAPEGIMPLFNEHFSIWSNEELGLLGQALIDVSKKIGTTLPTQRDVLHA